MKVTKDLLFGRGEGQAPCFISLIAYLLDQGGLDSAV